MNYFEDHIGDYAAATAHLSWDEDMAYTRLIRAYYHAEKPIPKGQAYRLARATTPSQRKAVDTVLAEFFTLSDDGHHQKRCDEEIARFQDKQAKAKRSANARWGARQTHSEGNSNASPDAMRTHMRTHSEGNAPSLQTPDTNPTQSASATPAGLIGQAFKRAGVNPTTLNLSDPVLLALIDQGATAAEFEGIAREAVSKGIAKPQPWVCTVLQQRRAQAQNLTLAKSTQEAKPWADAI